ncbi:carbohydrate-binding family 9-like protein [Maribacter sp.]|uniref:carbohydrate-binding family 9-like protein n=1 Tax=Maribacter sp. TaxID=1897614 RepID=UPI0025BDD5ED|nr:carbohydrate-binding family 9-like protein [Maribacter sp.]
MFSPSLTKKKLIAFLLFLLYVGGAFLIAQNEPRSYVANKVIGKINIDGKADESSWQKAKWTNTFIDIEGVKVPKYKTQVKMLWDDVNLYFFAQLEEPHVWASLKQRDTIIFYNNDFEIFIDPEGDTHNYYEYEMNALNTIWDLFLSKPYRNNGRILGGWDFKGLQSAVHVQGTLNNPTDIDKGWSVEIAIPWSFVTEPGGKTKIPKNEFWRINFSRVNWDFSLNKGKYARKKDKKGNFLHENNWVWSPQGVINMHEPEHWGYVYFSEEEVGVNTSFTIPKDEHIKWYLYQLFRNYSKDGKADLKIGKLILGEYIIPDIHTYEFGWTISVKSPFTNKLLSVTNEGKFKAQ